MKVETTRCDLCGVICTNRSEEIKGKDYCYPCLKAQGLLLFSHT